MDLSKLSLPFSEDEIEWRIGQCGKKGNGQIWAMCLAYVQARAVMNRLDDVCGPENWRTAYRFISGSADTAPGIICELSIFINGLWVTKEDGAEQTDIESFKGGLSSSLKRTGSTWGIGRYLYKLEANFATIVSDRKGANWGKTKDGTEFYWTAPPLPAWALPDPSMARQNHRISLEQPGLEDGDPNALQTYRIDFGKYAGYNLEEISITDLRLYIEYIEKKAAKDSKPIIGKVADFIQRASNHIAAFENSPSDTFDNFGKA